MGMKLPVPHLITTPRLELQRLKYEDADEIFYTYASKPEVTRFVSWPTHERLSDTRRFLEYAISAWDAGTDYSYAVWICIGSQLLGPGLCHRDLHFDDEPATEVGWGISYQYPR
jgi:ribosomal-protein-alanine N-acetyltransferase